MVCVFKVPHSHLVHKHYVYVDKNKLRPDFSPEVLKSTLDYVARATQLCLCSFCWFKTLFSFLTLENG